MKYVKNKLVKIKNKFKDEEIIHRNVSEDVNR